MPDENLLKFVTYFECSMFIRSTQGAEILNKEPKSSFGVKSLQVICWKRKFGRSWLSLCMQAPN